MRFVARLWFFSKDHEIPWYIHQYSCWFASNVLTQSWVNFIITDAIHLTSVHVMILLLVYCTCITGAVGIVIPVHDIVKKGSRRICYILQTRMNFRLQSFLFCCCCFPTMHCLFAFCLPPSQVDDPPEKYRSCPISLSTRAASACTTQISILFILFFLLNIDFVTLEMVFLIQFEFQWPQEYIVLVLGLSSLSPRGLCLTLGTGQIPHV